MSKSKETTRTRKSRKQPKGTDKEAVRNEDGVAVEEKQYIVPTDPSRDLTDEIIDWAVNGRELNNEVLFLDSYARNKADLKAVIEETGLSRQQVDRYLTKPLIQSEIREIESVWRYNRKMTAERAAAKHIKLMEQLETDYHEMSLDQRTKMATPLMKASETYLKASGHMNHGNDSKESQVIINIDLGDGDKPVDIEGEVLDD